jgi:hypothetical protein
LNKCVGTWLKLLSRTSTVLDTGFTTKPYHTCNMA